MVTIFLDISMRSASRTVLRPTPRDSTSSASVGSLSPGPKPPFVSFPKASGLSFHPGSVFPCIFPLLYTHNLISCRLGQTIHNRLPQMVFPKAFRKNNFCLQIIKFPQYSVQVMSDRFLLFLAPMLRTMPPGRQLWTHPYR